MSIESIFGHNFLMVNRTLLPELGRDGVIVLSYFADLMRQSVIQEYVEAHNGFFFVTWEKLEEEWGYTSTQQRRIFKELTEKRVIETRLIGCPPKRHIRLNEAELDAIIARKAKPVKKPDLSKERETFYADLNRAIFEGFDTFKTEKSNLLPVVALPLYIFTRLVYKEYGLKIEWNGKLYSQFKGYVVAHQPLDYNQLITAVRSSYLRNIGNDLIVVSFKKAMSTLPTNSPDKQVFNPTQLSEWAEIIGDINE